MPRRKPKPEKVIQEKIKESLDSIIMEESLDSIVLNTDELPRLKTTEMMNFSEEKTTALADAQALLDSISAFYVDPEIYGDSKHVDLKKKIDATNLSAMMFQLKSAQHAIVKLLEEIDLGNVQPRLFEVLAQLQSQIMQMPKDLQQYLDKMETSYKKAKLEVEEKKLSGGILMDIQGPNNSFSTGLGQTNHQGVGLKSRGTRGLMEGLRDILGSEIVDVKPVDENPNAIVNARIKKSMDPTGSSDNSKTSDFDPDFSLDDEILE